MKKGLLAKKIGMTQIFDEHGNAVPVTVLQAGPCPVVQKKTVATDGYDAIQLGFMPQKEQRLNRPERGHFKRANVAPTRYLAEFRLANAGEYEVGQELRVDIFQPGDRVDVTGISKGKGFAGSIKRHGQRRGPMSHGSHYHRGPGSLGSIDPARVFKGRPLPGRMGGERVTVQNLEVLAVDTERNLMLVKGSTPGIRGAVLRIRESVKNR
ncbi:MAG: 50S ribosomal protein L3 [Firmicutes bacterium]|nr:50S ribosomal protein L3 [Bacillota bacterium]HOB35390.1 50S ribosomal protein L3 [Bacillota bacterium]HPZ90948.1 50S ribosomal protein L3 [Bacillota bacterium]HQE01950.1 50S ribosomal protein L3 [Bacillota bacterium]